MRLTSRIASLFARSSVSASKSFQFETLENRKLMSASVIGGTLFVYGTAGNDRIEMNSNPGVINVIQGVGSNKTIKAFDATKVSHIKVSSFGGNDKIYLAGLNAAVTVDGGAGNDWIEGSAKNDVIHGGTGDDTLYGWYGNDLIDAGSGNDYANGSFGDDAVYGGTGNDIVEGWTGNDRLAGQDGNDQVHGQTGDDMITGDAGNDRLTGDDGNDKLYGGTGDDDLFGGLGNDLLDGGDGNDNLDAGLGFDKVYGGRGNDSIYVKDGLYFDVFNGGEGWDRAKIDSLDLIVSPGHQTEELYL